MLVPYRFALKAIEREKILLVNNITWIKSNPTPRQFNRRLVSSTEPFFHFVKTNKYYYDINSWQSEDKDTKQVKLDLKSKQTNIGKHYRDLIANSNLSEQEKKSANKSLNEVIKEIQEGNISGFRMKIRGIHAPAFGGQSGGRALQIEKYGFTIIKMYGKKIKRDVIISSVESLKGYHHPAVYPEKIIEEFIKLLTKQGDIVLDPFIGSGTTAVAARQLHRHFIGIDINPAYILIAEQRLKDLKLS
ncbi:MAG: DNA-methyltransferase [Caldisphaera sp.]